MDWMTFISNMTGHIAWPATVAAIAIVYRKEIRSLVERIKKLHSTSFPSVRKLVWATSFLRLRFYAGSGQSRITASRNLGKPTQRIERFAQVLLTSCGYRNGLDPSRFVVFVVSCTPARTQMCNARGCTFPF
jgi:hypothetical protein